MATVGSFVVNTYMNNDNFLAGAKAAAAATKKMETSIGDSISKINAKQLKGAMQNILGGLGTIGLIEAGLDMANELVKGFKDGSIKGFGDAVTAIGQQISTTLEGLPIVGSGGKLIASMLDAVGYMGGALGQEQQQQQSRIEAAAKEKENYAASQASAKILDEKIQLEKDLQAIKDGSFLIEKSSAELAKKALSDRMMNAGMDENQIELANRNYDSAVANKKIVDDELSAQKDFENAQRVINGLELQAEMIGKTAREREHFRLGTMKGMTIALQEQGMAAWDAVQAEESRGKAIEDLLSAQEELSKSNMGVNEAGANLDAAQSNRTASATSVDSALGSIKLQGVTDFSKSQEIEKAKEALSKAIETASNTKGTYDQLVKLNQAIGATP
jgi:hypothetical protein